MKRGMFDTRPAKQALVGKRISVQMFTKSLDLWVRSQFYQVISIGQRKLNLWDGPIEQAIKTFRFL